MTTDPMQSTDSTDDSQAERNPFHSRRGFLKAASAGILGVTGLAGTTEVARACVVPDTEYRLSAGEAPTFHANGVGVLYVEGRADTSDYFLSSPNKLYEWCGVEPHDEMNKHGNGTAYGEVNDRKPGSGHDEGGHVDVYRYYDSVYCKVTSGIVDVTNYV
jgi:hypothetical protein